MRTFGASVWPAQTRNGNGSNFFQELSQKFWRFGIDRKSGYRKTRADLGDDLAGLQTNRLQADQLFETPENPVPAGAELHNLTTKDGVQLRAAMWPSRTIGPARNASSAGTILLCQGRSEFIEKYFELVEEFLARGFCVVAFDWRGQGGSQRALPNPRKGHVDDFSLYWQDIDAITRDILTPHCPKPWSALGHSMGGAILLDMAGSVKNFPLERLVLTAPMIDLYGLKNPGFSRFLASALNVLGLAGRYAPGGGDTMGNTLPFAGNVLTSDPARYARSAEVLNQHPQIGLGHPTVGWIHAAFRTMDKLMQPEFPRRTYTPTLILGAGADRVVSLHAIEAFAHRLKAGRLIILPHAEHEILVERDVFRAQFWAAVDAFLPNDQT